MAAGSLTLIVKIEVVLWVWVGGGSQELISFKDLPQQEKCRFKVGFIGGGYKPRRRVLYILEYRSFG